MDRERAIEHLKAIIRSEERAAHMERPYLDRHAQRATEQGHWNNVQALRWVLDELETFIPIPRLVDECPEPITEGDEHRCLKCMRRWPLNEDRPECSTSGSNL